MKLLMITQKIDPGHPVLGFACDWVEELSKQLDQLFVICFLASSQISIPKTSIYQIAPQESYSRIRKMYNFYKSAFAVLKKEKIDGIFVHQIPLFAVLVYPLAVLKSLPVILWYTHGHVSFVLKLAQVLVNKILTASKESCRLKSKKIEVMGHGININKFMHVEETNKNQDVKDGRKRIVSIGRFCHQKIVTLL